MNTIVEKTEKVLNCKATHIVLISKYTELMDLRMSVKLLTFLTKESHY